MNNLTPEQEDAIIEQAKEIMRKRYKPGARLDHPTKAADYLRIMIGREKEERVGAIYLDNQHQVIATMTHFYGTLNTTRVYPEVFAREALARYASSIILYHNHPSGKATPSPDDVKMTELIRELLGKLEIRVLDHIIVTPHPDHWASLSEMGLI